jgi:hypothetical protein
VPAVPARPSSSTATTPLRRRGRRGCRVAVLGRERLGVAEPWRAEMGPGRRAQPGAAQAFPFGAEAARLDGGEHAQRAPWSAPRRPRARRRWTPEAQRAATPPRSAGAGAAAGFAPGRLRRRFVRERRDCSPPRRGC